MNNEADTTSITAAAKAPPDPFAGGFPSIMAIGRQIRAEVAAHDHLDVRETALFNQQTREHTAVTRAKILAFDRWMTLADLALTLPAQTLGDAAVQAVLTFGAIDRAQACDLDPIAMAELLKQMRRGVLSILPVVAREAGLTLDEIADGSTAEYCAQEFSAQGVVP